jgi:hypothetical protein
MRFVLGWTPVLTATTMASVLLAGCNSSGTDTPATNPQADASTSPQADLLAPPSSPGSPYNIRNAPYLATGDGVTDDSAALQAAIDDASAAVTKNYPVGPNGSPQNVVTVPAGTYRVKNILLKSNVRLEADAGASFFQAGGPKYVGTQLDATYAIRRLSIFILDAPAPDSADPNRPPLRNVSLVGVGSSSAGKPTPAAGWDISGSFTIDVDTALGGSNQVTPISLAYVDGVLIQNVITIQNNMSMNAGGDGSTDTNNYHPAIIFFSSTASPVAGPFYDPHNVVYTNHYHLGGVLGGGANQIQSVHGLTATNISAEGGIALRLENDDRGDTIMKAVKKVQPACCIPTKACGSTDPPPPACSASDAALCICTVAHPCSIDDASLPGNYGSEVRGVVANHIEARNGSAVISLVPHEQRNFDVTVTDARAIDCGEGLEIGSGALPGLTPGSYTGAVVTGIHVTGGDGGQLGVKGACVPSWTVAPSDKILKIVGGPGPTWSFTVSQCSSDGTFTGVPNTDFACNP